MRVMVIGFAFTAAGLILGGCASGNLPGASFMPGTSQVSHVRSLDSAGGRVITGVNATHHVRAQEVLSGPPSVQQGVAGPQEVLSGPPSVQQGVTGPQDVLSGPPSVQGLFTGAPR